MTVRTVSLTEYRTGPSVHLDGDQIEALSQTVRDLRIVPTVGLPGHFDLTPGSTVGTAVVRGLRVDIAPKVRPSSLLYMMSEPFDPRVWRPNIADMDTAAHLVEAFLTSFLHHTENALRRGPLHRYASRDERLPTIRGRIMFEVQLRSSPGLPLPAQVRYDEHTVDIDENRVLRAAIRRLRYVASDAGHQHRLNRLEALLADVASVSYTPFSIPSFTFDRLNEHYRAALNLSTLALRNTGLEHRLGHQPAVTFLADMNKVFENFVLTSLRRHLRLTPQELDQGCRNHAVYLDVLPPDAGKIRLRPDISWWQSGRCVFVGDVKYKRLSASGHDHADLYQLLAYLTALDLKEGLLVYPTSDSDSDVFEVPMASKRLRVHVLGVDGDPQEIDREVGRLVATMRAMAVRALAAPA